MALLVLKFGGTSVADIDRIRNVAAHVKREVDAGHACAVVVSAMAGQTNQLVAWSRRPGASRSASKRRRSSPTMMRANMTPWLPPASRSPPGCWRSCCSPWVCTARSWQGWQIPLQTDGAHRAARITGIAVDELKARMLSGEVAVVAGFQGIGPATASRRLAAAAPTPAPWRLAAALDADRCDIYTDVDGVYTTDPRVVPKAHRLDRISYEEMLEMASQGAKVLQTRSVELAMQKGVRVLVRSSFDPPDLGGERRPSGSSLEHSFAMRMRSWSRTSSAELPMPGTRPR